MVKNQHIQTHMEMRKQSALKEVLVFFFKVEHVIWVGRGKVEACREAVKWSFIFSLDKWEATEYFVF